MTPTQRTLKFLRDRGLKCGIVEKFISQGGSFGIRQDLFGIIDIIALDKKRGVIGVQSTGTDFSGHRTKLMEENGENTRAWLETPGTSLELITWRKVKAKRGGKLMIYKPRVALITIEQGELQFTELTEEQIEEAFKTDN